MDMSRLLSVTGTLVSALGAPMVGAARAAVASD